MKLTADESLRRAVRDLRLRFGADQTTFAKAIGKSYPMTRRYETLVAPQGEALAPLALLARRHGFTDLEEIFSAALVAQMPEVVELIILRQSDRRKYTGAVA